jgi:hypothetical protein
VTIFKIDVFLKKRFVIIFCSVLLSEKRRYWQLISQKVHETVHFSPFLYISSGLDGLSDIYDFLHHHPQAGPSPCPKSAHQAVLEPPAKSPALS